MGTGRRAGDPFVYLYIRQVQYQEARTWLDKWETEIVKSLCCRKEKRRKALNQQKIKPDLIREIVQKDEECIARSSINILYYRGEICFLENEDEKAQNFFSEVIKQARQCEWGEWTRRINYAQNWLADILIRKAKNALNENEFDLTAADKLIDEAQTRLMDGLLEAEINYDKRRRAYYKCSRTQLEKVWGYLENKRPNNIQEAKNHFKQALRWAESAKEDFERLGMKQEKRNIVAIERDLEEIKAMITED